MFRKSVQELAVKFGKELRHVSYETALQQLWLFSLACRRIRGNLFSMYKPVAANMRSAFE